MALNRPASVSNILERIADAMRLLATADVAFQTGNSAAAELYASVDRAHGEILERICAVSEEQADSVEPALSQLEIQLFHGRRGPQL